MRRVRRLIRVVFGSLWLGTLVVVVVPVVVAGVVLATLVFVPLPATIPVARSTHGLAEPTILYAANGQPIATLTDQSEDVPVLPSQIPAVMKEAIISSEDRNFYHEGGIDLRGILRALVADMRNRRIVEGASTITMQYVKLTYTSGRRSLITKIREALLASQLNRVASKNEILYRYLTTIYFGDGNYGIGAAAEDYFHVPVSRLDASQAATLAGLVPAPSYRAPRQNLAAAELFREVVLREMFQQRYLTAGQYRAALRQRLALVVPGKPRPVGPATLVYPVPQEHTAYPAFVAYVTAWLLQHFSYQEVYAGGLRVQTTLEPYVQHAAQDAVDRTLSGTRDPLEMALAAVQPQTGYIVALVGHRQHSTFANDDFALGGCPPRPPAADPYAVVPSCLSHRVITGGGEGRQPGSSWKAFVLATAFKQGIPPTKVYKAPVVYHIPQCRVPRGQSPAFCQIRNDEGYALGSETLAEATAQSTNTVYAQVAPEVGCANVARTARAMGITTAYWSPRVFPSCSRYALGELGVSPLDMASAYGVFADHGLRAAPTPILEIVGPRGRLLVDDIGHRPPGVRVLPANVASNVTGVLRGVITHGTGVAAALGRPAAGKTGTANNETNAWFVGYTPSLSAAVWMGNAASEAAPLGVVKGVYPVVGGTWPAITWRQFMLVALRHVRPTRFSAPAPITPPAALRTTPTTVPSVGAGAPAAPTIVPAGALVVGRVPQASAPPPPPGAEVTTTTLPGPSGLSGPGSRHGRRKRGGRHGGGQGG